VSLKLGRKPEWSNLTPRQRSDYVNQDCVTQNDGEIQVNDLENISGDNGSVWEILEINNSSNLKYLIIQLHLDGKKSKEIAEQLPCNAQYCRRIIKIYRDFCTKNATNLDINYLK